MWTSDRCRGESRDTRRRRRTDGAIATWPGPIRPAARRFRLRRPGRHLRPIPSRPRSRPTTGSRHFGMNFHTGRRTGPHRLPARRNAEVRRRYQAGESPAEIARDLGTTARAVRCASNRWASPGAIAMRRVRRRQPKGRRRGRAGPAPPRRDEVGGHRGALGLSICTVRRRLAELGNPAPEVPIVPRPPRPPARPPVRRGPGWLYRDEWPKEWREIGRRYQAGESTHLIGKAMGIHRSVVLRRLDLMGIPRRDREAGAWPRSPGGRSTACAAGARGPQRPGRRCGTDPPAGDDPVGPAPPRGEVIEPAPASPPASCDGPLHWNGFISDADAARSDVVRGGPGMGRHRAASRGQ